MIKAVLFDLDGILVPACELHKKAFDMALGFELTKEEHETQFNGLPTKKKLEKLVSQGRIKKEEIPNIWERKQNFTKDLIKELKVNWAIAALLQELYNRDIKIVCVTNSIRETAELMLKQTGIFEYFNFIITNEDVIENKPSPACYKQAMWQLYLSKSSCLILEDSEVGLQAAIASGAHVLKCVNPSEVTMERIMPVLKHLENNNFAAIQQQIFGV
jgi:beta-phosphoglucomutase